MSSGIFPGIRVKTCVIFPPSNSSSQLKSGNILEVLKAAWQVVQEKNTDL